MSTTEGLLLNTNSDTAKREEDNYSHNEINEATLKEQNNECEEEEEEIEEEEEFEEEEEVEEIDEQEVKEEEVVIKEKVLLEDNDNENENEEIQEECEEGEEEEESEEEEEEEESEEEEELADLKFELFRNPTKPGESISFFTVTLYFVYVGTSQGHVFVLDLLGNQFAWSKIGHYGVNDISADEKGEFFVACNNNGLAAIHELNDKPTNPTKPLLPCEQAIACSEPVLFVALHPNYRVQADGPVILGHRSGLVINTKGRFTRSRSSKTIDQGKISGLSWHGNLVAYATSSPVLAIKLYDPTIGSILFEKRIMRPDIIRKFRCCFFWESDTRLLCAWGDDIQSYDIERKLLTSMGRGVVAKENSLGLITTRHEDSFFICGIAPFNADYYIVMAWKAEDSSPEVRLIEKITGNVKYNGPLPLGTHHPTQYYLAHCPVDGTCNEFFLVSHNTIIKAVPTNADDLVLHLVNKKKYERAFEEAKKASVKPKLLGDVGDILLNDLARREEWEMAAKRIPDICGLDINKWEKQFQLFTMKGKLHILCHHLPNNRTINGGPRLQPSYYNRAINSALQHDPLDFKRAIDSFDGLYDVKAISAIAEDAYTRALSAGRLKNYVLPTLGSALARLFEKQGKFSEALVILMRTTKTGSKPGEAEEGLLFDFINKNKLFTKALEILPELFVKNKTKTLDLLMGHVQPRPSSHGEEMNEKQHPLCPDSVIRRLENHEEHLAAYLERLCEEEHNENHDAEEDRRFRGVYLDMSQRYAQSFANVFIKYNRDKLFPFLKEFTQHLKDLRLILEMCKTNGLLEEYAYLLTRMGQRDEGLKILVEEMKNVRKAMEAVKDFPTEREQDDCFKRIVAMARDAQSRLDVDPISGISYAKHIVKPNETYESIAKQYGISTAAKKEEGKLRTFGITPYTPNMRVTAYCGDSGEYVALKTMETVAVPINMWSSLLEAVGDPNLTDGSAIDLDYLIKQLPSNTSIPGIGRSLRRVAESKERQESLAKSYLQVLNSDYAKLSQEVNRIRSNAIRMDPRGIVCQSCHQSCIGGEFLVFAACGHSYHSNCLVNEMFQSESIKTDWLRVKISESNYRQFLEEPAAYLKENPKTHIPHCAECKKCNNNIDVDDGREVRKLL